MSDWPSIHNWDDDRIKKDAARATARRAAETAAVPAKDNYEWVKTTTVTNPFYFQGQFFELLRDYWWVANKKGEVCFYRFNPNTRVPQANLTKSIVEFLGSKIPGYDHPVRLSYAFLPIRPKDYA